MIVLEELGLDYQPIFLDFSEGEHKAEAYTKHNPNGRIPTLIDHKNGDLTVWLVPLYSGSRLRSFFSLVSSASAQQRSDTQQYCRESDAIITYLVDKYDPAHKLSFARPEDKIHQLQWLFFQSSGQGFVAPPLPHPHTDCANMMTPRCLSSPYFGQAGWFLFFASEKLPSAIERYQNEIVRVLGVLEKALSSSASAHHGSYLVGGKASVADLSFILHVLLPLLPGPLPPSSPCRCQC